MVNARGEEQVGTGGADQAAFDIRFATDAAVRTRRTCEAHGRGVKRRPQRDCRPHSAA